MRILSVDSKPVDTENPWNVNARCGAKGLIFGRAVHRNEAVWVLVTENFEDNPWRVLGKASIKNGRYWELSPKALGNAGAYLKMIAVVSQNTNGQLNTARIEDNVAFSEAIQLVTKDEPPVHIKIDLVDRHQIKNGQNVCGAPHECGRRQGFWQTAKIG